MLTVTHIASARELLYDVNSSFFQECTESASSHPIYVTQIITENISRSQLADSWLATPNACKNPSVSTSHNWHHYGIFIRSQILKLYNSKL